MIFFAKPKRENHIQFYIYTSNTQLMVNISHPIIHLKYSLCGVRVMTKHLFSFEKTFKVPICHLKYKFYI